jgi:hypothetical protein
MIIKGRARGRSAQLASHLLRSDQNERIQVYECRGTVAQDVHGALGEMETLGALSRSKRPLYHASISPQPDHPLSREQIDFAVDLLEAKLGLQGRPRVVVQHRKQGREHTHVVWSRIDTERGRAISDSCNYARHEEAARQLEKAFGHAPVPGAHGDSKRKRRSKEALTEYELRQSERSGISREQIRVELSGLWRKSADGHSFKESIEKAGYRLARGDRRGFVVIDRAGECHSLARRLEGAGTAEVNALLSEIALAELPSVAEARTAQRCGIVQGPRKRPAPVRRKRFASKSSAYLRPEGDQRGSRPRVLTGSKLRRPRRARFHSHRAEYAQIVSMFAAKIADALTHGDTSQTAARIARLRQEEAAYLEALERKLQAEAAARSLPTSFRRAAFEVTKRQRTRAMKPRPLVGRQGRLQ